MADVERDGIRGPFPPSPSATPRKVGTTKKPRQLICGAVLLAVLSGAGFGVPAALGHGDGRGSAQQQAGQGPPWGRGPGGDGPPGQMRTQAPGPGPGAPGNGP